MKKFVLIYVDTEDTPNNTLFPRFFDTKEEAQAVMKKEFDDKVEEIEGWDEEDAESYTEFGEMGIYEDSADILGDEQYIWRIYEIK